MSTRSYIGYRNDDGTVTYAYCHFDGYPEHHAPILLTNYATREAVQKLVSGGDMVSLGEVTEPPVGMAHWAKPVRVCVYYGRDRGEDGTNPRTQAEMPDDEWGYLMDADGVWWCRKWKAPWRLLRAYVNEDGSIEE